ncbi:response regulator transcription factor [Pseudanabaena sp. 'Roaring Creek']|uniref:response regulator n=1 Tax=Pseudanabaena sp. 'Roaring Creek' TaxID=1681830 RepID=UPI0006D8176B|nr:response regulator transcription factor [Pseudanabaena sp. 'Roaring Creek']
MIQILLIDDQDLIRRGMKALLKSDPELQVIGEGKNGLEAIVLVETLQPDIVLMDVRMPEMDGVAATREIAQMFPQIKVLIMTTFDDREYITQALRFGASGYLLKDTPYEELTQAIRLVYKGYTQLSPGLANKLLAPDPPPANSQVTPDFAKLTPREQEILQLIAKGANNREIAIALFISEKTVRNNITNIFSQLGLRDRTQAAIWMKSQCF